MTRTYTRPGPELPLPPTDTDALGPEGPPEAPAVPGTYSGSPFDPTWRSALDDPLHPLHHLRDA